MTKPIERLRRPPRDEVRRRLIVAAAEVLAERGYEASLEEITERAGFSRGAFYSNFESKEDLLLAALQERTNARIEELEELLAGSNTPLELLSALGTARRQRRSWDSFAGHMRFLFYALARRDLRARLARMERARQRAFAEAATRLLGDLSDDAGKEVGRALSALDHGLAIQTYLEGKGMPLDFAGIVGVLIRAAYEERSSAGGASA